MKELIVLTSLILSSVLSFCHASMQYRITDFGLGSSATGINDSGHVAVSNANGAYIYDGTTMKEIGTLGGDRAWATHINNSGHVLGMSDTTEGNINVFLYDGTTIKDLGTLGLNSPHIRDFNDSGYIAGFTDSNAFLYDGTTTQNIGTLGGTYCNAYGMNNSGYVVGSSTDENSVSHAFIYDGTTIKEAGTGSSARDINDNGQVVGSVSITDGTSHAFLYDEDNGMRDLNDLIPSNSGWDLTAALDINSSGQIIGYGEIDGQRHSYLLTPVPEPTTFLLVSFGILLIRKKYA